MQRVVRPWNYEGPQRDKFLHAMAIYSAETMTLQSARRQVLLVQLHERMRGKPARELVGAGAIDCQPRRTGTCHAARTLVVEGVPCGIADLLGRCSYSPRRKIATAATLAGCPNCAVCTDLHDAILGDIAVGVDDAGGGLVWQVDVCAALGFLDECRGQGGDCHDSA